MTREIELRALDRLPEVNHPAKVQPVIALIVERYISRELSTRRTGTDSRILDENHRLPQLSTTRSSQRKLANRWARGWKRRLRLSNSCSKLLQYYRLFASCTEWQNRIIRVIEGFSILDRRFDAASYFHQAHAYLPIYLPYSRATRDWRVSINGFLPRFDSTVLPDFPWTHLRVRIYTPPSFLSRAVAATI